MTGMADVVVVGSCMTDLISYVPRLPKPGETIQGDRFSMGFGGKGANQCVMAARLGAATAMVAKVGDDSFGHNTVQNFKDNKIETSFVKVIDKISSGAATIFVNEQGENSIVIVSGANSQLDPGDVQAARDLISSAKVLICQFEVPLNTSLEALKLAKQNGVLTILNAAPGTSDLDAEFYKHIDILCVNETEAELLSGQPVTDDMDTAVRAVQCLQAKGPGRVVLTLGKNGALFSDRDKKSLHHVKAPIVDVKDTTGAGDAFVGAMAYYLACQSKIASKFSDVVHRAIIIASHTVTQFGTQTSFVTNTLPHWLFSAVDNTDLSTSHTIIPALC